MLCTNFHLGMCLISWKELRLRETWSSLFIFLKNIKFSLLKTQNNCERLSLSNSLREISDLNEYTYCLRQVNPEKKNEADFKSLFWKTVIVYMWSDTTAKLSVFDKNIPRHINVSNWLNGWCFKVLQLCWL